MSPACYTPPVLLSYWIQSSGFSDPCLQILQSNAEVPEVSLSIYLTVFLWTLILESPFYLTLLRSRGASFAQGLSALLLCNLATHPVVCFVIPFFVAKLGGTYGVSNTIGEIFAPLVEALLLWRIWKIRPVLAFVGSIAANLFSWWVGVYAISSLFLY